MTKEKVLNNTEHLRVSEHLSDSLNIKDFVPNWINTFNSVLNTLFLTLQRTRSHSLLQQTCGFMIMLLFSWHQLQKWSIHLAQTITPAEQLWMWGCAELKEKNLCLHQTEKILNCLRTVHPSAVFLQACEQWPLWVFSTGGGYDLHNILIHSIYKITLNHVVIFSIS